MIYRINKNKTMPKLKYIKKYENFNTTSNQEELNEGLKDWLIGGLIALSSIGGVMGQDKSTSVYSPEQKTELEVHKLGLDDKIQSKLLDYHKLIKGYSSQFKKTKDGKYTITEAGDLYASAKEGGKYTIKDVYIIIGDKNNPSKELQISHKDNGNISVTINTVAEKEVDRGFGGVLKAGSKVYNQCEMMKGDKGYSEALELLNMF
jgi:uncharacterized glyoxalase superfamily protein PhnB